jgi:hypothetical protein
MASMDFEVDLSKVDEAIRTLEVAISEGSMEDFFDRRVGPWLAARTRERFASEGDDASGAWAPLTQATINRKRAMGYLGRGINVRTGELRDWATDGTFAGVGSPDGGRFTYPREKPRGRLKKKVSGAQNGTERAPARPVIAFSEFDAEIILQMFATHLESIIL